MKSKTRLLLMFSEERYTVHPAFWIGLFDQLAQVVEWVTGRLGAAETIPITSIAACFARTAGDSPLPGHMYTPVRLPELRKWSGVVACGHEFNYGPYQRRGGTSSSTSVAIATNN